MTIRLNSLAAMATRLVASEVGMMVALERGLERALVVIERTAQSEFGVYQDAVGPHPAWPELADATKDQRVKLGFMENDPLLRTGDLRGSISHERVQLEGAVGSTSGLMPFHEFGTQNMPARPVLGPAAFRNRDTIKKLVGAAVVSGLIGSDQVHAALGYDLRTTDL